MTKKTLAKKLKSVRYRQRLLMQRVRTLTRALRKL